MPIAKGSRSTLTVGLESSFGVIPANATRLGFVSESMGEQIGRIVSNEIRYDRTVPNIRGGNIAAGGDIVTEFSPTKNAFLLRALLCANSTPSVPTVNELAHSVTYTPGTYVKFTDGTPNVHTFLVITEGSCTSGELTAAASDLENNDVVQLSTSLTLEKLGTDIAGGAVHLHTLNPGIDFHNSFTVEKAILGAGRDLYIAMQGLRVASMALNIPQDGLVQATWSLLGLRTTSRDVASGAAGTYFSGSITDPVADKGPFAGLDVWVNLGDDRNRPVREGSININNNVESDVYTIGSRFRRDIPEGRRECTGNITTYFEDEKEYDVFKNESVRQITFGFHRGGQLLQIIFPECKLTGSGTPVVSGPGVMTSSFEFSAFKNTAARDVQVLFNTESSTLA